MKTRMLKKKWGVVGGVLFFCHCCVFGQVLKKKKILQIDVNTGVMANKNVMGIAALGLNAQLMLKGGKWRVGYRLGAKKWNFYSKGSNLLFTETQNGVSTVYNGVFCNSGNWSIPFSEVEADYNVGFYDITNDVNVTYYFLNDEHKASGNFRNRFVGYVGLGYGVNRMGLSDYKTVIGFKEPTYRDYFFDRVKFNNLHYIYPKVGVEFLYNALHSIKLEVFYCYYLNNLIGETDNQSSGGSGFGYGFGFGFGGGSGPIPYTKYKVDMNSSYFDHFGATLGVSFYLFIKQKQKMVDVDGTIQELKKEKK